MTIYCDYREAPSTIPALLTQEGIQVQITQLPIGDYILLGKETVCVERKTTEDYVGSLKSKHLNNQLYEMSYHYDRSFLILEGAFRGVETLGIARNSFVSSITGTVLERAPDGKSGIVSLIPTDTVFDTVLVLKYIHERIESEERLFRLPALTKAAASSPELRVVMGFPGIGEETGRSVLTYFETTMKFFEFLITHSKQDAVQELRGKIKGFGPKTIERCYEVLDKRFEV